MCIRDSCPRLSLNTSNWFITSPLLRSLYHGFPSSLYHFKPSVCSYYTNWSFLSQPKLLLNLHMWFIDIFYDFFQGILSHILPKNEPWHPESHFFLCPHNQNPIEIYSQTDIRNPHSLHSSTPNNCFAVYQEDHSSWYKQLPPLLIAFRKWSRGLPWFD